MAEVVEGKWKDFVFKMIQEEDISKVLKLIRHNFLPSETLCSSMCKGEEEFDKLGHAFAPFVTDALKHGLSFCVEHQVTKEVVGARITNVIRKGEEEATSHISFEPCEKIMEFLTKASEGAKIFEVYPDVDHCADLFMIVTSAEFRGQGLASEMYQRTLNILKAKEIPLVKSVLTSPYTRIACKKLNFNEHYQLYLNDFKDKDGSPFFKYSTPDQFVTVVAKRIE